MPAVLRTVRSLPGVLDVRVLPDVLCARVTSGGVLLVEHQAMEGEDLARLSHEDASHSGTSSGLRSEQMESPSQDEWEGDLCIWPGLEVSASEFAVAVLPLAARRNGLAEVVYQVGGPLFQHAGADSAFGSGFRE